jgi:hypothetical protein
MAVAAMTRRFPGAPPERTKCKSTGGATWPVSIDGELSLGKPALTSGRHEALRTTGMDRSAWARRRDSADATRGRLKKNADEWFETAPSSKPDQET